ncbi:hypothetical protein, partial [Candidatus Halocynthiibacter alkanivorans]|uniref:hypothetical protein n=1 Tax=Candidatus Halocynthiibacter alkanivorans TaxID=2267619 RepID=UPI001F2BF3C3
AAINAAPQNNKRRAADCAAFHFAFSTVSPARAVSAPGSSSSACPGAGREGPAQVPQLRPAQMLLLPRRAGKSAGGARSMLRAPPLFR